MTTEPDQKTGGTTQARRLTPASVQINMPKQESNPKPPPASMDAVEGMLERLLNRLDDNDKRYGAALAELNHRLDDLSKRTHGASTPTNDATGESLERLRNQASQLAAQVNEAGTLHQTQGRHVANDDRPTADLGENRLNMSLADVTQRLEETLASHAPAGDIDFIARRLDELGGQLDAALSRQNDVSALHAIENQLRTLSTGFGEAQQNYARLEAIENNLANLMHWAHAGGSQPSGNDAARLDTIEQTLQSLDHNAREMDARTVSTLEAMNNALHSIANNSAAPRNEGPAPAEALAPAQVKARQAPAPQPQTPGEIAEPETQEAESQVWIEECRDADYETSASGDPADVLEKELGASIPDYQPAPARASKQSNQAKRVEPTFESSNDFLESARRAAAAAAQEPDKNPSGKSLSGRLSASLSRSRPETPKSTEKVSDSAGKPRRILYVLAAGLMLTSAGLMYIRLQNQPPATTPAIEKPKGEQTAPPKPEQKPENKAANPDGAPKTQTAPPDVLPKQSKATERMSASPPAAEQPPSSQGERTPQPAAPKPATLTSSGPVSTATLLASLTPKKAEDQMPGVAIEVTEPAPAPSRKANVARTQAALVPDTAPTPSRNPLALPRRVPAPETTPQGSASKQTGPSIDSAPANELTRALDSRVPATSMPPARIGPNSLRVAAARGNPAAQVEIASRYAKGTGVPKDMKKAIEWYGRAAAQGFAPGQYRLAALYERGQGVKKDASIARTWYRRAAQLGNIRAMHNLAVLYTRNEGKGPDYTSAKNWFYQAARYGLADSQFNLGILYDSGLGVKKNAAEAYKWFSLAARQGDTEAAKRRETLRPRLPGRSLAGVEQSIRKWRSLTPPEKANRSGPPRGGWRNAEGAGGGISAASPEDIKRAQLMLNKLGYDAGAPDGKIGPQTVSAIRRFQNRAGLTPKPGVTPELLRHLLERAG